MPKHAVPRKDVPFRGRDEGLHQCVHRLRRQRLSNQPELSQVKEAGSAEFCDVVAHAQLTLNLNTQIMTTVEN